jgi:hypothetical protein
MCCQVGRTLTQQGNRRYGTPRKWSKGKAEAEEAQKMEMMLREDEERKRKGSKLY